MGVLVSAWVILLCVWDTEVRDTNSVVYGIMEMCLHVYACVKITRLRNFFLNNFVNFFGCICVVMLLYPGGILETQELFPRT